MNKLFSLLLAAAMLLPLAACGAAPDDPGERTAEGAADPAPAGDAAVPAGETEGGGNILIAYFSWSGNTEKLAEMIADETGGTLFAIEPETAYSGDYNAVVDQAKQEQNDNARPAVAGSVEGWENYDTVFVGYPNWWSDVPMVVLTFLESCDWSGKTVVPFCTSGGGGCGRGVESITDACAGASVLEGFHVGGGRVDDAGGDVTAWLEGLGL